MSQHRPRDIFFFIFVTTLIRLSPLFDVLSTYKRRTELTTRTMSTGELCTPPPQHLSPFCRLMSTPSLAELCSSLDTQRCFLFSAGRGGRVMDE